MSPGSFSACEISSLGTLFFIFFYDQFGHLVAAPWAWNEEKKEIVASGVGLTGGGGIFTV